MHARLSRREIRFVWSATSILIGFMKFRKQRRISAGAALSVKSWDERSNEIRNAPAVIGFVKFHKQLETELCERRTETLRTAQEFERSIKLS